MYSNYDYIDEEQNEYLFKLKYYLEKVPLFSRFLDLFLIKFYKTL